MIFTDREAVIRWIAQVGGSLRTFEAYPETIKTLGQHRARLSTLIPLLNRRGARRNCDDRRRNRGVGILSVCGEGKGDCRYGGNEKFTQFERQSLVKHLIIAVRAKTPSTRKARQEEARPLLIVSSPASNDYQRCSPRFVCNGVGFRSDRTVARRRFPFHP